MNHIQTMRSSKRYFSDISIAAAIVFLMMCCSLFQAKFTRHSFARSSEKLNYLPSGKFLKGLALGFDEAMADFLWVQTVGYFGTHLKTDRDYRWLTHRLGLIIQLDPYYESPYEFAGVILPTELNDADTAIEFLKKGVENIPRNNPRYWLQPFYLGFCYMIYKDQPIQAARYFEQAAAFPQRPPYLPMLVTRLYASENKPEQGIRLLQQMLNDPNRQAGLNEYMRKSLIKRIKELTAAQQIQWLEDGVAEYERFYGAAPASIYDLVDGYIIPFIPLDPFGGYYQLSDDGKTVISTSSVGKFVVYKKKEKMPKIDINALPE